MRLGAVHEPSAEALRLQEFEEKVQAAVSAHGDARKLASEVTKILEPEDLRTAMPAKCLFRPLMTACREQEDDFVINLVHRFVPVVEALIAAGEEVWRYKMKFL